jgi:ketosteroid isomerase-like protein
MKKRILYFLSALLLISCLNKKPKNNQEIFDRNVATFNKVIEAFVAEDTVKLSEYFADSLQWVGPGKNHLSDYSNKQFLLDELKKYFSAYEKHTMNDVTYYSGSIYSTDKTSDDPNQIEVFGNRYHTHTATGKELSHKWMAVLRFDKEGKIYFFSDFFDITGFLNEHE